MSAEIVQFVPRLNPCRPTLLEGKEAEATEFLECAPLLAISQAMAGDECFVDEVDICNACLTSIDIIGRQALRAWNAPIKD